MDYGDVELILGDIFERKSCQLTAHLDGVSSTDITLPKINYFQVKLINVIFRLSILTKVYSSFLLNYFFTPEESTK